ncbi:MAG: hypothetical protein EXS48_01870 [Candidatus Staskawiczbacteria bacterium]|nr:hypothetical protein [Candidatus Staskawiczbacteria bacterium]
MEGKLIELPHYPLTPFLWTDGDVLDPRVLLKHLLRDFHGVIKPLEPGKVKALSWTWTVSFERLLHAPCGKDLVGLAGEAEVEELARGTKKELHNNLLWYGFRSINHPLQKSLSK